MFYTCMHVRTYVIATTYVARYVSKKNTQQESKSHKNNGKLISSPRI